MRKKSSGKFGTQHADLLIKLARDTIGIKEGIAGVAMDIHHILMQLEAADGFIEEIESEMKVTLARIPYSARILSIKGLGAVSVAGIIGEVGDFSKFRTQSEIMKLAGFDLYEISSGKRKGQRRISKRGRGLPRSRGRRGPARRASPRLRPASRRTPARARAGAAVGYDTRGAGEGRRPCDTGNHAIEAPKGRGKWAGRIGTRPRCFRRCRGPSAFLT